MLKRIIVQLLGRERANRVAAPYHDWLARRQTLHRLATLPPKDLCINIGCGPNFLAGWINVDIARSQGVDIVWDLRQGLPFASESCLAIFGEHVIEHMTKTDAKPLLRECYRVLQPEGILRLSTPDAGRFLRSYAGDGEFLRDARFPERADTLMDRVNQHLWAYDADSLLQLLRTAGFSSALEQQFGVSVHARLRGIDSEERAFESLYVEAIK
jgi:predicted SAM-dependent methyltransferase